MRALVDGFDPEGDMEPSGDVMERSEGVGGWPTMRLGPGFTGGTDERCENCQGDRAEPVAATDEKRRSTQLYDDSLQ